ncbi:MAG TPA: dephospho-CoA kinase [Burkholderiaceae bacterium]
MGTPVRLGLTGGIGSGKSTVAQMLVARGAALADADAVARQVTGPGGAAMPAIAARFGPSLVTAAGALDRDAMRALAFSDPAARGQLEAIVHPLVLAGMLQIAAGATAPCVVFDIPLLAESSHWRQRLDRILVVDCSPATQVARVVRRSGIAPAAVEQIIAAQASRMQRLAIADAVLYNDGNTLEQLQAAVDAWARGFGL